MKKMMDRINIKNFAKILLWSGVLLAFWYLAFGGYLCGNLFLPDVSKVQEINPFITGLVVPLLTLGSTLLIFESLRNTSQQNFSNNFLSLIKLQNHLIDNIKTSVDGISNEKKPHSLKTEFFDDLAYRIATDYYYLNVKSGDKEPGGKKSALAPNKEIDTKNKTGVEKLKAIYEHYYYIHQNDLGHYFRSLYYTVRYAHYAPFSDTIKKEHLKVLRAQLSNYEMLLLAYNGLMKHGEKFFPLIEKYELLKSLNTEEDLSKTRTKRIVDFEILMEAYPHLKKLHAPNKN